MMQSPKTVSSSQRHHTHSEIVRQKFIILLLITLTLMLDTVIDVPSFELFEDRSQPEMPVVR